MSKVFRFKGLVRCVLMCEKKYAGVSVRSNEVTAIPEYDRRRVLLLLETIHHLLGSLTRMNIVLKISNRTRHSLSKPRKKKKNTANSIRRNTHIAQFNQRGIPFLCLCASSLANAHHQPIGAEDA